MTTVLLSSGGRRVELLNGFRAALGDLGLTGRVLVADRSWYSSARHAADAAFDVPSCSDPDYVARLVEICAEQSVDLVVPTIDPELPVLAAARDQLAAVGTRVAVSAPETITIAGDKVATHAFLDAHAFPTVRQDSVAAVRADHPEWPFPLVVKPRFGSAGQGVAIVRDAAELDVAARVGDVVVETVAPGVEYTIDALVLGDGRCVCAVPRRRIEVRSGEVSKAVTVRSPTLQSLATDVCDALPGAYGVITVQVFSDDDSGELAIIEVNARFGGGFPLTREAGADYPRWLLEDLLDRPSTARPDEWRDGLVMLRYDAAVFVDSPGRH